MSEMETADAFLPQDYEAPKKEEKYMKFEDGANKFRILSAPVLGWEYWKKSGKDKLPVRLRYTAENGEIALSEAKKNAEQKDQKAKHFWAVKVWNYGSGKVQILQITQKAVQSNIRSLIANQDWGNPVGRYDITVTKTGKEMETEYSLAPSPHKDTSSEVIEKLASTFIDLEALFYGADPFDPEWEKKQEESKADVF